MNLIKVKFLKNEVPTGRDYTYKSDVSVAVGDTVIIDEKKKGVVTDVDVPESEIEAFRDKIKTIVGKYLERKVYSSYAFKEDECEKSKINHEIYKELKAKWRISDSKDFYNVETKSREPINFDDFDLVYTRKAAYAHGEYAIHKNTTDLGNDELALIFDGGNLCFGYAKERENFFYVSED